MRKTSAKTVTHARYFLRYSEIAVGADGEIADTTQLLLAWAAGDARALDALAPRIYPELHRIKREREEPILQAPALMHEVYLKLVDVQNLSLAFPCDLRTDDAPHSSGRGPQKSCVPARRRIGTDSPG